MLENSGATELPRVEEERQAITVVQERHDNSGGSGGVGGSGVGGVGGSGVLVVGGSGGGNRWPHEETLALLKIRLEMDAVFRDTGFKGPLWDEVSRKLAELGHHRSAKKCREKFENMCKYHKRTKHQGSRLNGKAYRFYDILEAFEHNDFSVPSPFPEQMDPGISVTPVSYMLPHNVPPPSSSMPDPIQNFSDLRFSESSSDEESEDDRNRKKKWEARFSKIVETVLEKQENMLNKCLEIMDRSDRDRMARFEAWKNQEMARLKREQEVWEKQMSIVAARDAALIEFLKKISERGKSPQEQEKSPPEQRKNPPEQEKSPPEQRKNLPEQEKSPPEQRKSPPEQGKSFAEQVKGFQMPEDPSTVEKVIENEDNGSSADRSIHSGSGGSSRWPKEEVDALIKVRTDMEHEHQGSGSKGPLWEEISAAMKKLGYDRNAKRCKEKWENINKYYRRAKESNKKRSSDSKACAYFPQLDALYSMKIRKPDDNLTTTSGLNLRPEELLMHMVNQHHGENEEEEPQHKKHRTTPHAQGGLVTIEGMNDDGVNLNGEDEGDGEDTEENEGGEFRIVANGDSSKQIME